MDNQNLNWRAQFPEAQRDYILKNWRAALEKLPGMNVASLDNIVLQTEKSIYETAPSKEEYQTRCLAKIEEVKNSFGQNPQQLAHNNNLQFMGMGQVPMMNQQLGFNPQHQQIPPQLANLNPAMVQQMNPALLQANPNLNMLTQFQRANLLKQQSIANPNFQALQQLKLHQQQQQQLQNLQAAQAQHQAQKLQDQVPAMQHMPGQNMAAGIAQPQQGIVRPTTAQVANATQIPSTLNLNTAAAKASVVPANSQNPAGVFNYPNQFVANGAAGNAPFGNMNFQALLAANPQLKQNLNPTQLAQLASVQNLGKQFNPAQYQMLLQAQAAQNQVHAQSQALSMTQNQVPRPLSQQMPTANLQQNQPTAITQPNLVPPGSAQAQINPNAFMSPAMVPQKLANQQPQSQSQPQQQQQPQPNPAQSPAAKPANSTPTAPVAEQPPVQASPAQSPHVISTPSNAQAEKTDAEIVKIINQLSEQVKNNTKAPQPIPNLSAQDQLQIRQELEKIAKLYIQIDRLIFFTCKFTNESATLRLIKIKGLIQSQMAVANEGKFGLTAEMISKLNQDLMRQHTRIENSIKGPNSAKLGPVSMAQTASTNSQTTSATTPTMVSNTLSSEITPLPLPPTNVTPNMPQRSLPTTVSQATTVESAPQSAAPVTNINPTPQTTTMVNPAVNPLQNPLMMNFGNPVQPPGMNQMGMMPQNLTNAAAISMMANMAQQAQNPVRPQPVRTTRPGRPPRKQSQQLTAQALVRPPAGSIQQPQFPHFTIPSQQMMMAGNRPMQVPLNTMNQFLYNQGMMRPAGVYPQMTVGMTAGMTTSMTAGMPAQVTQPVTNPAMPVQVKQEPVTVKTEAHDSELQKSVTEDSVQQIAQKASQDSKLQVKPTTTEAPATSNSPLPEAFKSAVDHMKLNITNLQIPPNVKRKTLPQHLVAQTIATNSTTSPSSAHPSANPTNPFARALSTASSKDPDSSTAPEDPQPKRIKLELPERDTDNPLAYTTKALELLKHRNNFDKFSKLEGAESVLNNIPKSTRKSINEVFGVVMSYKN